MEAAGAGDRLGSGLEVEVIGVRDQGPDPRPRRRLGVETLE